MKIPWTEGKYNGITLAPNDPDERRGFFHFRCSCIALVLDHVICLMAFAVACNRLYYMTDQTEVTLKQNLIYLVWSFDYTVLWLISKWFKKRYAYYVPILAILN